MEDCKEKILIIIRQSSLSFEETNLWEETVKNIPDDLCLDVLWFLQNTPNGVRKITDNIKDKVIAINNDDVEKWEAILQKDADFLKSLEK